MADENNLPPHTPNQQQFNYDDARELRSAQNPKPYAKQRPDGLDGETPADCVHRSFGGNCNSACIEYYLRGIGLSVDDRSS